LNTIDDTICGSSFGSFSLFLFARDGKIYILVVEKWVFIKYIVFILFYIKCISLMGNISPKMYY